MERKSLSEKSSDEKNNFSKDKNDQFLSAEADKDHTFMIALADLKINNSKNSSTVETKKKRKNLPRNKSQMTKTHISKDRNYPNFFGKRIVMMHEDYRAKYEARGRIQKNIKEAHKFSDVSNEKSITDVSKMKSSPKASNIQTTDSSSMKEQDISQIAISDKMKIKNDKNLIDKLRDFKIFSPALWQKKKNEDATDSNDDDCIAC